MSFQFSYMHMPSRVGVQISSHFIFLVVSLSRVIANGSGVSNEHNGSKCHCFLHGFLGCSRFILSFINLNFLNTNFLCLLCVCCFFFVFFLIACVCFSIVLFSFHQIFLLLWICFRSCFSFSRVHIFFPCACLVCIAGDCNCVLT